MVLLIQPSCQESGRNVVRMAKSSCQDPEELSTSLFWWRTLKDVETSKVSSLILVVLHEFSNTEFHPNESVCWNILVYISCNACSMRTIMWRSRSALASQSHFKHLKAALQCGRITGCEFRTTCKDLRPAHTYKHSTLRDRTPPWPLQFTAVCSLLCLYDDIAKWLSLLGSALHTYMVNRVIYIPWCAN